VAKEEIAPEEQFLPLPQCFQMSSAVADVKTRQYEVMGSWIMLKLFANFTPLILILIIFPYVSMSHHGPLVKGFHTVLYQKYFVCSFTVRLTENPIILFAS
jgi:hypothetical protein